jgi:5-methylcytosine-specific restriction endonuclease McrA
MHIKNLNDFVMYLSDKIKFNKSVAGQRALMTSRLRKQIKERDGYTCKHCGLSVSEEPHLLLEIDHIIPVSKGGLTTESNLQTLCWRCNRSKGAKM